ETVVQLSLILACSLILFGNSAFLSVRAQVLCGGEPQLMVPSNPRSHAWVPGSNLAVVVFNPTSDPEFEKIRDGAVKWNSHALTNCPGFPSVLLRALPLAKTLMAPRRTIRFGTTGT